MPNLYSVEVAIHSYHRQVEILLEPDAWLNKENLLSLLQKRDQIQFFIDRQTKYPHAVNIPTYLMIELSNDDAKVGSWEAKLAYISEVPTWRKTINPPTHHWWWFPKYKLEPSNRPLEAWMMYITAATLLISSILIYRESIDRILENASDVWKTVGNLATTAITLVIAGGPFTKIGKQFMQRLFKSYKSHWRFSITLFLISTIFFFSNSLFYLRGLPIIADRYNQHGLQSYFAGNTIAAQSSFKKALRINPKLSQAHHNLALIYEDTGDFRKASNEYLRAVQSGFLPSINNLARLRIVEEQSYDEAVLLISRALVLLEQDESDENIELEYSLRKNLGWARLEQNRLQESLNNLVEAKRLEAQIAESRPDVRCLLARLYDKQGKGADAKSEWEACLSKIARPEDDFWRTMANEALKITQE
ncbi:MAG: tetratricopeptide repeat protein [Cyanobacteria bacterium J06623_4]